MSRGRVATAIRSARSRVPATGSGLLSAAAVQAIGGAACWMAVLALWGDGPVGVYGRTQLGLQLGALLGAAGVPVVVLRFGAVGGRRLRRATLVAAGIGGGVATVVALGAGRVGPGLAGWVVVAATAPLAAAGATVDAWLVVGRRWRTLFTRLGATSALRLAIVAGAADAGSVTLAVLAVLGPEALTVGIALGRTRGTLAVGSRPAGLRAFAAAQYVAALTTFGPILVVPLLVAGRMTVADRAAFLPAWAGMAMTFTATHGALSGRLVDGGSARRRTLALSVGGGIGVGVLASVSAVAAGGVGIGGRWVGALAITGLLLVAGAPWPAVAARLTGARREGRNRLAVALVAPIGVVPLAVALGAPATPGSVGAMWGAALLLCGIVAVTARPETVA